MPKQKETTITVLEMTAGKVTAIHKGETDTHYMPIMVVQMDVHPTTANAPLCIAYIEIEGDKFFLQATDGGSYNLVRDIRLASCYETNGAGWLNLPSAAKRRACQYFDGSTQAEIMPAPTPTMFDLLPTAPSAPSITMKTGHPGHYTLNMGNLAIDIFMPDDSTAQFYLFRGTHLPQFTLVKLAADGTDTDSFDMWLPTIGITGQDQVSFNERGGDYIGCDLRKVDIDTSVPEAIVIKQRK